MQTYIYPFSQLQIDNISKPYLPIRIINPHNNNHLDYLGLVDTGADCCMVPAWLAEYLGHDIKEGKAIPCSTANSKSKGYNHALKILIRPFVNGAIDTSI